MDNDTPVGRLLQQKRDKLLEYTQAAERVRIEIATLEEALSAIEQHSPVRERNDVSRVVTRVRTRAKHKRRYQLSEHWQHMLAFLATDSPNGFGYENIETAAKVSGAEINMVSVRTQIMNFVNKDLLERVRPGRFRVTEAGRIASGLTASKNETPPEVQSEGVSDNTGEGDASPDEARGLWK